MVDTFGAHIDLHHIGLQQGYFWWICNVVSFIYLVEIFVFPLIYLVKNISGVLNIFGEKYKWCP